MQKLQLGQYKETVGPQTQAQLSGLNLVNMLLGGKEPLPGFFQQMSAGISPEAIGTQATELTRRSMPGFQNLGLADSGVAFRNIANDIANQLLFPAEQFNIGAKQNLLNLALSGQAQVQQPVTANTALLGQQLAGLRSITTQGTTTTSGMNPFLKSFQTSLGSSMGSGIGGGLVGGLPGFGAGGMFGCWVAVEIFGSWKHPKTIAARYYIQNLAPLWFKNFYMKYGERIAKFLHNKPILKLALQPLFELFAMRGMEVKYA